MMSHTLSLPTILIALALLCGFTFAQDEEALREAAVDIQRAGANPGGPGPGGPGGPPAFETNIEALLDTLWMSRVDGEGLEVSTTRIRAGLTSRIALNADTRLDLGFRWEHAFYDFDGLEEMIPGARERRLDEFIDAGFSAAMIQRINLNWGWFLRATARFSGQPGADFGDSIRFGGFGGVEWRPNRTWTLRFGAGGFTRIEEDPLIIPLITARWAPSRTFSVDVGFPETRIDWRAGETWGLFLAGRFDFRDYRLDQGGPLEDGVLRDDAIRLELGFDWQPDDRTTIRLAAGAPIWREVSFDDRRGDRIIEADLDPGPTLRAELRFIF
jgi:uncharacterized protein DUF6268